jgi:predicted ATPase
MKILDLNIKGFLSFKDTTWHPGDLNVVVGANASGKSNLLEVLILLRQMIDGRLSEHLSSLGGIDLLTWNRTGDSISINGNFQLSTSDPVNIFEDERDPSDIRYSTTIFPTGNKNDFWVMDEYLEAKDNLSGQLNWQNKKKFGAEISRNYPKITFTDKNNFENELATGLVDREESSLPIIKSIPNLPWKTSAFAEEIVQWQIFKPIRTDVQADARLPQVTRIRRRINNESDLPNVIHTMYSDNADFCEGIDSSMSAAFPDYEKLAFPPSSEQKIELSVKWRSLKNPTPAISLSDGTLRFLFLITALLASKPGGLIAIDEPETGLHPRMFDIIAGIAKEVSGRTQVIFTTHSTEFLNAMSRFAPTTTIARLEDGETKLETVDKETLAYWLKEDFLGDMHASGALEAIA